MPIRGMHDIKTHATLAREGKLVSVARDWHKRNSNPTNSDSDWNTKHHVYNKPTQKPSSNPYADPYTDEKIKGCQVQIIKDQLQEMHQAVAEGLEINANEFERLEVQLFKLEGEN